MFLEESLTQQRNEMMDGFAQILRQLPTSNASSSSGGATLFKVQIKFDIPIFKGHIDLDVVDKWLNLLEGYFSIHNFSNREKITFALLKAVPHVKDWWETFCEQKETEELIQVDIGGHPPFPIGSKQFSGNFGNLLFLAVFNFRGHFEALNDVFLGKHVAICNFLQYFTQNKSPR